MKTKTDTILEPSTKPVRKARVPRQLTELELEAKRQFDDAKALGKILPAIDKLGVWGLGKVCAHIAKETEQQENP